MVDTPGFFHYPGYLQVNIQEKTDVLYGDGTRSQEEQNDRCMKGL